PQPRLRHLTMTSSAEGEGVNPRRGVTAQRWAVRSVAKAGPIGIIGVYPPTVQSFPIGEAMNKNLAILAGNCNHRRYIPELISLVASGAVEPDQVLTQRAEMVSAIEAYEAFDSRRTGWTKVALEPARG
ncbi:MAG: hypothetical protein WKF94_10725, partial [Solirubrobacteraceae bacterium]